MFRHMTKLLQYKMHRVIGQPMITELCHDPLILCHLIHIKSRNLSLKLGVGSCVSAISRPKLLCACNNFFIHSSYCCNWFLFHSRKVLNAELFQLMAGTPQAGLTGLSLYP